MINLIEVKHDTFKSINAVLTPIFKMTFDGSFSVFQYLSEYFDIGGYLFE